MSEVRDRSMKDKLGVNIVKITKYVDDARMVRVVCTECKFQDNVELPYGMKMRALRCYGCDKIGSCVKEKAANSYTLSY